MENKLEQSINDINKLKESVNEKSEDKDDPSLALYNGISDIAVKILSTNAVKSIFSDLASEVGEKVAKSISELMAICMTHSAFEAIVFYDELLKGELTKQFNSYGDCLNNTVATVNAQAAVIKILRKRIEDFTNTKINDELKS